MTATSEQMSDMWFGFDRTRNEDANAEESGFPDLVEKSVWDIQEPDRVVADAATAPSYAAAKLLEIATCNADALVDDAREQADRIVSQAAARAEEMIRVSSAEAGAREEAMNAWAEEQRVELELARGAALRELEVRRAELETKVNRLVEFESQYRSHLISYIDGQLETLHGPTFEQAATDVLGARQS